MKVLCCVSLIMLTTMMWAESIPALLKQVQNNHTLHMKYQQQGFICTPYGIETISQLVERVDVNSSCQQYLRAFRLADPKEEVFASSLLYPQQQYGVEGIESKCLLYLSHQFSYSERLLEKGYARVIPTIEYKDPILKHRFNKAIKRAKITKAGLWSDPNLRNCFLLPAAK